MPQNSHRRGAAGHKADSPEPVKTVGERVTVPEKEWGESMRSTDGRGIIRRLAALLMSLGLAATSAAGCTPADPVYSEPESVAPDTVVTDWASLQRAVSAADPARAIALGGPITSSDTDPLRVEKTCVLDLQGYPLQLAGEIWMDTDEEGQIVLRQAENLTAAGVRADTPDCELIWPASLWERTEEEWNFYVDAKRVAGIVLDNTRVPVRTEQQLAELLDADTLPILKDGTTLVLMGDNWQADKLQLELPACSLEWKGQGAPSWDYVVENWNVRAYKGKETASSFMGGPGTETVTGIAFDDKKMGWKIPWTVKGNVVEVTLPYYADDPSLKQAFVQVETGGTAQFNQEAVNADGSVNLLEAKTLTVTDSAGKDRRYRVDIHRAYGQLPVVRVDIQGGKTVRDRDTYLEAAVSIENAGAIGLPDLDRLAVRIRGRGHSTWLWEKKPYKLHFEKKVSVLGLAAAKEWTLLANYADKTLIRNTVAFDLSRRLSHLAFSPTQYPVDLFVNGRYEGVYSLGEQITVGKGRVEIPEQYDRLDTGYLLEVGGTDDGDVFGNAYFHTTGLKHIAIKSPDPQQMRPEQFAYIQDYMTKADAAVRAGTGYEEYLDVDSVIDWVILHELTNNTDCAFRRSCYFTKTPGGRLQMGPAWDFDLAFGNFSKDNPQYNSWATTGGEYVGDTWFSYLLKDPAFVERFRARWNAVKEDLMRTARADIDTWSTRLAFSQASNFHRWDILGKRSGYQSWASVKLDTYEQHVQYLRDFLEKRYRWLDKTIAAL